MRPLKFKIDGSPVGQGRPRFARIGKRTIAYDPEKSREQKAFIKYIASESVKNSLWEFCETDCFCLKISSYFEIAKSKSKKFRQDAITEKLRPTKKCDIDNLAKLIMDALTGIVYQDDKQVVELHCYKYYAEEPCTVVEVSKAEVCDG